jgi:hypothetical protein
MGQSFLFKSFSSKNNNTRRKNKAINNTPSNSMDYEKQFRSQNSHSSGSQRLPCTLCPGKPFKDNNRLKIHVDKYHIDNNLSSSTFSSTDSITKLLIHLKLQLPTIRRLPKACRHLAADKLTLIINNCLSTKSISSFENLLLFFYRPFNVAEKSDKSLNKHIKKIFLILKFLKYDLFLRNVGTNLSLAKKVEAKVADFDIKGAVKLLSSDHSLASFNEDVAKELKKKHPLPSRELFFPDAFKPGDFSLIVNEQNIREAIISFPGSSPGLDGMRPQYILEGYYIFVRG